MNNNYVNQVRLKRDSVLDFGKYPYSIATIKALTELEFDNTVTFFVGENGTGKSTLLEAIAVALGFNAEGGSRNFNFHTYDSHSKLSDYLVLSKGVRLPKDGYFLRAESYYNVATNIEELDSAPSFSPLIKDSYGGKNLHECSHGESFFALLQNRLGGNGIYLFDEPEAALSPQRQLAMICKIGELVKGRSQLIIATHSPILLAFPNSTIYSFDGGKINKISYEDTEHFQITKNFLNNHKGMIKMLLED